MKGGPVGDRDDHHLPAGGPGTGLNEGRPVGDRDLEQRVAALVELGLNEGRSRWGPRREREGYKVEASRPQ